MEISESLDRGHIEKLGKSMSMEYILRKLTVFTDFNILVTVYYSVLCIFEYRICNLGAQLSRTK